MSKAISDIAIIGAGMTGLSCASALAAAGRDVRLFDKGRGPGGRMAARRAEIAGRTVSFDHGAQYFTARDEGFAAQVERWKAAGVVSRWPAAEKPGGDAAWVGVPGMNGPLRAMATGLAKGGQTVAWGTRIEHIERLRDGWRLSDEGESWEADRLVIAVPAEQARTLLRDAAPDMAAIPGKARSAPCWSVMVAFAEPLGIEADALREDGARISWAARNSAKPARSGTETWMLHASPARSLEVLELPKEKVAAMLLEDFFAQTGAPMAVPIHLAAHRWLYAMADALDGPPAHYDADARIGLAGDYLHSPRVEGAWLSGQALARLLIEQPA